MRLLSLRIKQFRNFAAVHLPAFGQRTVFVGNNAQGKTNLLEAIYCMATLRSFRTSRTTEMIKLGEEGFFIGGSVMSSQMRHAVSIYYSSKKKRFQLTAAI